MYSSMQSSVSTSATSVASEDVANNDLVKNFKNAIQKPSATTVVPSAQCMPPAPATTTVFDGYFKDSEASSVACSSAVSSQITCQASQFKQPPPSSALTTSMSSSMLTSQVSMEPSLLRHPSAPPSASMISSVTSAASTILLLRSESRLKLQQSLSQVMRPGLTGLKEFMSSRQLPSQIGVASSVSTILDSAGIELDKFIDYFIDCDGLRYLGILEQFELDFENRCKAALLTAKTSTQHEAEFLRGRLNSILEVELSNEQKTLHDFNFPELLNSIIKGLPIDYKPKITAIRRIHEYGIRMEEFWTCQLELGKHVDKNEIYTIGTQMLAELMGQLFSLLVKSCEFLIKVNEDAEAYRHKYTANSLIHLFSEFRSLLVEEVGAVGETCGLVMIKIPHITDDVIVEIMTKLYNQVNFVDICMSKALRAVVPMILLYVCNRRINEEEAML